MGREESGDFHLIINEWGGEWVVPEPGEDSNDLKARRKSWACHYLPPLTYEPEGGMDGLLYTPLLILSCLIHEGGSFHSFYLIVITMELLRPVREGFHSQTFPNFCLPHHYSGVFLKSWRSGLLFPSAIHHLGSTNLSYYKCCFLLNFKHFVLS
jgi:hypothetical protein